MKAFLLNYFDTNYKHIYDISTGHDFLLIVNCYTKRSCYMHFITDGVLLVPPMASIYYTNPNFLDEILLKLATINRPRS